MSINAEHWDGDGAPWDRLTLGAHPLPGLWTVEGDLEWAVEVKKSPGRDGARLKDTGRNPAEVVLVGKFGGGDEWSAFLKVLPDLLPANDKRAREPLYAYHPALEVVGVDQIYLTGFRLPAVDSGILTVRLTAIEWFPSTKTKKPGTGATKKATAAATPPDVLATPPPPLDKLTPDLTS